MEVEVYLGVGGSMKRRVMRIENRAKIKNSVLRGEKVPSLKKLSLY